MIASDMTVRTRMKMSYELLCSRTVAVGLDRHLVPPLASPLDEPLAARTDQAMSPDQEGLVVHVASLVVPSAQDSAVH